MINYHQHRFTPVLLPTTEEEQFRISAEKFEKEVDHRGLGAFVISNPCNPTANVIRGDELKRYVAVSRESHCTLIMDEFRSAYQSVDVLVSPTSPTTAFPLGDRTDNPLAMYLSDLCTIPSNLSGDPGMSVPIGVDDMGLPIGFQVMAPALGEEMMFRFGAEVERLADFDARAPLATSEVSLP